jgi:hypothetical protein
MKHWNSLVLLSMSYSIDRISIELKFCNYKKNNEKVVLNISVYFERDDAKWEESIVESLDNSC